MIYHLRNVRNWADFVAEVGDFSREAPRCGSATIIYGARHRFQCSAVACRRFRHYSATCSAQSTPRLTVNYGER